MTATTDRHGRLVAVRTAPGASPQSSPESSPQLSPESSRRWGRVARSAGFAVLAAIPLVMFALFFFYPVGSLIGRGLTAGPSMPVG